MFESAKQKVHRADRHIADFTRQSDAYIASKPHSIEIHTNLNDGFQTVKVRFVEELPIDVAYVIADAIHNLRTALDHLAWELASIGHGSQDRYVQFTSGSNRVNFEASCNGIVTPSQWVKDALLAQEVFPQGRGHELYSLCELNNRDKHKVTAPVLLLTSHPDFRIINASGKTVDVVKGTTFQGRNGSTIPVVHAARNLTIEWDKDAESVPGIFFSKPDGVDEPVWSMLRGFRIAVVRAITEIEAAVP
jgi:hypothetical protein